MGDTARRGADYRACFALLLLVPAAACDGQSSGNPSVAPDSTTAAGAAGAAADDDLLAMGPEESAASETPEPSVAAPSPTASAGPESDGVENQVPSDDDSDSQDDAEPADISVPADDEPADDEPADDEPADDSDDLEPDVEPTEQDAGGAIETMPPGLEDPGPEGDGNYEVGPNYAAQPELTDQGAQKGRRFRFSMPLASSAIFDGKDATLDPNKPVNQNRNISVYVPASYSSGTPAPVLVIQDGDGPLDLVANALDNLTTSSDPQRQLPAFIAVAVQNGGDDAQGSERGLEYDTMSDRYARFIDQEVLPAVIADPAVREAYPDLSFTINPSGRAALGCSSGAAAAFTMAWFRPDLFSRVVAYSTTLVDQQNHSAAEAAMYPHGAWDYHSELELIANSDKKPIRVFLNVNDNDLRASDPESTFHNWVMANERTADALAAKEYHYRYVVGRGAGHCDAGVQRATLADALIWVWRGYQPTGE